MAERAQELGRLVHGPPRSRARSDPRQRALQRDSDPQRTEISTRGLRKAAVRGRRRVGVARRRAEQDVVEQRHIQHAAPQAAVGGQAVPVVHVGQDGDPSAGRLEAEQPAHRRWDTDRSAAVGSETDRHHPRRDRRRRAAARPARRQARVPGIADHAVGVRLGQVAPDRQLGKRRPPDDRRATLYDHQLFNFAGAYGNNGWLEDYTAEVRGEPIGCAVLCWSPATPSGRPSTWRPTTGHAARCCSCPAWWARSSPAPRMPSTSLPGSPETDLTSAERARLRAPAGVPPSE